MKKNLNTAILFIIFMKISGFPNMGSFLNIVVKLFSYTDSEVGNLRKFEHFYEYLYIRVTYKI